MTTGVDSYGSLGTGAIYYYKSWSGSNGKTEAWVGGIRTKWNSYTLAHQKMSQRTSPNDWNAWVPALALGDSSYVASLVGWSTNDDLRLLNKLAEAIRGHSLNLGINIAEASKSYDTIVGNLRSVGAALLHLKHGRFTLALRALGADKAKSLNSSSIRALGRRDLAGRWLETQYAFIPLVKDSYEAAKALQAVTRTRVWRFSVGSGNKRVTLDNSTSPSLYHTKVAWSFSKRIKAELSEDIPLERSLGLTNPAAIAWEVVPYSFVVDWFLPVGSYLEAFGMIPKLKGRFCTTERGTGVLQGVFPGDVTYPPGSNQAAILAEMRGRNRKDQVSSYKRTPSSSLSVPSPTFASLPKALSSKRIVSAVALIHQSLSR